MKTFRFASIGALLAIAGAAHAAPYYIGVQSARNDALVTPAPYPPNKTDDVRRAANSREWVSQFPVGSRTPIDQQQYGFPGWSNYGASSADAGATIYVRVNHVPIAMSPWYEVPYSANGNVLEKMEYARHLWLKENGYVQKVRTFRNPLYYGEWNGYVRLADSDTLPTPRATIRINPDMPERPEKMHVLAPMSGEATVRVSKPRWAGYDGPPTVIIDEPAVEVASGE